MSKIDSESTRDTRRKKSAIFALERPGSFPSFPCRSRAPEPPRCVRPMIACVPRSLTRGRRQDLAPPQSQDADVVLAPLSLERSIGRCVALGDGKDEGDAVAQLPRAGHVDDCAGREGVPEHDLIDG